MTEAEWTKIELAKQAYSELEYTVYQSWSKNTLINLWVDLSISEIFQKIYQEN
jgi:hypothetical protein